MYPFINVGSLHLGTYGICFVTGFFLGYFILGAELRRRQITRVRSVEIVFALALCALVSSKLYLALESPALYLLHPLRLLNRIGFTYYGGLAGAVVALIFLARRYRLPFLTLCDTLSVACALGYGIGRVGCFLAGDGDYGIATSLPWGMTFPHGLIPTTVPVHPAPLYEIGTSAAIALGLWRLGSPARRPPARRGEVFAHFLLWTGVARILVEFIKRNPVVAFGLVSAQFVGLVSAAIGLGLLYEIARRAKRPGVTGGGSSGPRSALTSVHATSRNRP